MLALPSDRSRGLATIAMVAVALIAACGGDEFQTQDAADASAGGPNGGSAGVLPEGGIDASTGGKAGTGSGGVMQSGGAAGNGGVVGTGGVAGTGGLAGTGGIAGSTGEGGALPGGAGGSGANGNGGSGAEGQGGSGQCGQLHDTCKDEDSCCGNYGCDYVGFGTTRECCLPPNADCLTQACCGARTCSAGRCCSGAAVECASDTDCCDPNHACKAFPGTVSTRCCRPAGSACDQSVNDCCSTTCSANPDDPNASPTCK